MFRLKLLAGLSTAMFVSELISKQRCICKRVEVCSTADVIASTRQQKSLSGENVAQKIMENETKLSFLSRKLETCLIYRITIFYTAVNK